MDIMKTFKWIVDNYEMVLNSIVIVLGALGMIVETVNRFFPTTSNESAMTKLGKFFAKAGESVKKLMDFLRIPNNQKKEEPKE